MSRPYRAGIVGLSGIASRPHQQHSAAPYRLPEPRSHAAAYHAAGSTLVTAVCDVQSGALSRFVDQWGSVATYTDYREMLRQERLDLLSICTPDHLHAEIFVDACAAGVRGIFCEKPLATSVEDADRMIAAAREAGVKAIVDHTRRFDPHFMQARWLVEQGAIGKVTRIVGTLGGERAMLFRNGTHLVDTILYFAGSPPSWVIALLDDDESEYGTAYLGEGGRSPVGDPGATALIGFDSGVRAVYNGSKGTVAGFELELIGETGIIRIGNQSAALATLLPDGGLAWRPLPQSMDMTAGMLRAVRQLVTLIESDGDGTASLIEARSTLCVLLAMLQSSSAGGAMVPLTNPEKGAPR